MSRNPYGYPDSWLTPAERAPRPRPAPLRGDLRHRALLVIADLSDAAELAGDRALIELLDRTCEDLTVLPERTA